MEILVVLYLLAGCYVGFGVAKEWQKQNLNRAYLGGVLIIFAFAVLVWPVLLNKR